jgi:hypothetical protein
MAVGTYRWRNAVGRTARCGGVDEARDECVEARRELGVEVGVGSLEEGPVAELCIGDGALGCCWWRWSMRGGTETEWGDLGIDR